MEEKEKTVIKLSGLNSGLVIKPNGLVDVKIEVDSTQLVRALNILQIAGDEFKVSVLLGEEKLSLGRFGFNALNISRLGDAKLSIRSDVESVNIENVKKLYCEQEMVIFAFISAAKA